MTHIGPDEYLVATGVWHGGKKVPIRVDPDDFLRGDVAIIASGDKNPDLEVKIMPIALYEDLRYTHLTFTFKLLGPVALVAAVLLIILGSLVIVHPGTPSALIGMMLSPGILFCLSMMVMSERAGRYLIVRAYDMTFGPGLTERQATFLYRVAKFSRHNPILWGLSVRRVLSEACRKDFIAHMEGNDVVTIARNPNITMEDLATVYDKVESDDLRAIVMEIIEARGGVLGLLGDED